MVLHSFLAHLSRRRLQHILFILAASLTCLSAPARGDGLFGGSPEFLPVDQALPFSFSSEPGTLVLDWNITPGHYLYQHRITITPETPGAELGEVTFSRPGTVTEDEFFGKVTVFFEPVQARVPVSLPQGVKEATLSVSYQGCAKAGLCYPPQTREVLYYPGATATATPAGADTEKPASWSAADTGSAAGLAGFLSSRSVVTVVALFFLLGLGLTFTPCVLPMVPIISSLVSGHNTRTTGHALLLSVSYVVGMALTYAAAGVLTGLLGASFNLQAQLQSPWVLGLFAALFVIFALSMFDLFEIQLPRFIRDPLNDASQRLSGTRVASIFGIGALSALVVSPCVSAPLAGALLYISTTQDAVMGGMALFALGLGMGVPLILVAVGGRKLLPSTGHWMSAVKHFYGVMLLAVAIWLVERLIPAWASLTLWGLLVTVTGVQLGALEAARAGWERTRKGIGLVLFAYGLALLAGAASGARDPLDPLAPFTSAHVPAATGTTASHAPFQRTPDPDQVQALLAEARQQGQPAMLDFYADWCISCKVMERTVFSDPEVIRALSGHRLVQIDMTDNTPEQQALLDQLGLFGPPAILFYNRAGEELSGQRILGEMDKEAFLRHLQQTANPS